MGKKKNHSQSGKSLQRIIRKTEQKCDEQNQTRLERSGAIT